MSKLSAGILAYNVSPKGELKVLLVHPGGPFWKNKDEGAWSIPKGEYLEGEDALLAAKREFTEETGNVLPDSECIPLQPLKIKSGKVITAWATKAAFDLAFIKSNEFEMEWPPRSGKKQLFPEVDKAGWFTMDEARVKINAGQMTFLDQLIAITSQ
ncbi:NUDIX domain-containing protein [Segetibacter aerophilus]|uniref:NTP pyrophosphohydrolase n=1 Tax=Segetibacter aerophilus TaxID=670293 RepID=A0A512B969_9BACT|nr:NUDIX domain-containing protein [Segetibacter aerophilus]GEO08489.1 NTP pyrophosphohydrolase [Segetibacter aerophilus]